MVPALLQVHASSVPAIRSMAHASNRPAASPLSSIGIPQTRSAIFVILNPPIRPPDSRTSGSRSCSASSGSRVPSCEQCQPILQHPMTALVSLSVPPSLQTATSGGQCSNHQPARTTPPHPPSLVVWPPDPSSSASPTPIGFRGAMCMIEARRGRLAFAVE